MGGKGSVSRAETARVLADIAEAVRPVERARTAAAVERVLQTATPDPGGAIVESEMLLGVAMSYRLVCTEFPVDYEGCCVHDIPKVNATPGLTLRGHRTESIFEFASQRRRYAPWKVSPHLFPDGAEDGAR